MRDAVRLVRTRSPCDLDRLRRPADRADSVRQPRRAEVRPKRASSSGALRTSVFLIELARAPWGDALDEKALSCRSHARVVLAARRGAASQSLVLEREAAGGVGVSVPLASQLPGR